MPRWNRYEIILREPDGSLRNNARFQNINRARRELDWYETHGYGGLAVLVDKVREHSPLNCDCLECKREKRTCSK